MKLKLSGLLILCNCLIFTSIAVNAQQVQLQVPGRGNVTLKARNFVGGNTVRIKQYQGTHRPQSCSNDSLYFTRQSQIDSFPINNPTCTVLRKLIIDGSGASPAITSLDALQDITQITELLSIKNTSITDLSEMSGLVQMTGALDLRNNSSMTGIGLNNLTELGGVYLVNLPALTSLSGITNNIDSIGGVLLLDSVGLTHLNDLNGIEHINGNLSISHTGITSFAGINSLRTVHFIWLDNDSLLTTVGLTNIEFTWGFLFNNLPLLSSLGPLSHSLVYKNIGTFWFISLPQLTDLSGMDSVYQAANFYLWFNPSLNSINGLEQLSGSIAGFSIWECDNLSSLAALSNVTEVNNGVLELRNLVGLNDVSGLDNITLLDNGLWITENPNLSSISNLNPALVINSNNGDTLRVFNNPQLSTCSEPAICNYINNHTAGFEIHDNAPGCNDSTQVQLNCGTLNCSTQVLKTWTGDNSSDWDDPLNWSPAGVPLPCDSVLIPSSASNFPELSDNTIISGLEMESGTELEMYSYNLNVYGNVNLSEAYLYGVGTLGIQYSANLINIESSFIAPAVSVSNYIGGLNFYDNQFFQSVSVSDNSSRAGENYFSENSYDDNLSITTNATDGNAVTYFADSGSETISGTLTININQPVDFEIYDDIYLGGNLIVSSNFSNIPALQNASIEFISGNVSDAHITKYGSSNLEIGVMSTNKFGGSIILDQPVFIRDNAHFTGGIVKTDSAKLLIFKNGASVSQYSSASYVDGPVRKIGNTAFTFPIGDSTFQGVCEVSSDLAYDDSVTAQYYKANPASNGFDTSSHAPTLTQVSGNEYWKINYSEGPSGGGNQQNANSPNSGNPLNYGVTLSYDSTRSGSISTIYNLRVAKWENDHWADSGVSVVTGNLSQAFVRSRNKQENYGIFTLATAPVRVPVITINPADSVGCVGSLFEAHFTLDTLMFPGNEFKLELSDSSGNFSPPFSYSTKASFSSDSITLYSIPVDPGNNYKIRVIGTLPPDTSAVKSISLKPFPSPSTVINGPATGCLGSVHKYWVTPALPGIYYNWSVNPGDTLTTNNDTAYIRWGSVGSHNVNVYCYNSCGGGINRNMSVTVSHPAPTDTPEINNVGRWLYASVPDANQHSLGYHWYRNSTLIVGANNSSYYASDSGSFYVKYFNLCGESPASNTIYFAAASVPQTINFPAIPNKVYNDPPFVPTATASSGLPVSFSIVSGPASINPITNLLTMTGVGTVTVKATQAGDNVYDTAAPVIRSFDVTQAPQTISFASIPDKDFSAGQQFTLNATASSGLPVSYSVVSGPASVSGSTVTLTGLGTVVIRASQSGNSNYQAAPDVDRGFCVWVSTLNHITGPNSICPGVNATYSTNNIPGATYTWRIAGGSTLPSATNSVTHVWPAPGNYTLIVSAAGSCGAASNNDSLSIVAVTSASPDSVSNMLPANGAINQQLPLTLSWVPKNPNLNYTFDIYLWRSDSTQPVTPYVSGISTVNYTIPITSHLVYNHTYNWMVVAHNGSCTVINTGPVQQFTLIPLPDLQPINLLAPASAFSGQTISLNWTIKNNGPGNTGSKTWTDAVFLSFDTLPNFNLPPQTNPAAWSMLEFPLRPLLVGTRQNVSALDSGQQYSNTINFTLPLNYSSPLYMYVISDYPHGVNAPTQTTYANDTTRAANAINVTLSPQPDLRVDTVFTPGSTFTGSTINLTYKVKNYGVLTPTGSSWYDKLYISNSPFFDPNTAIQLKFPKNNGTYYYNPPNAEEFINTQIQHDSIYTNNVNVVIPNFLTPGTYYIYVFTNATGSLYEGPNSNNNVGYNLMQVFLTPTPVLTISSLYVPVTTASTTQSIGINWNIKNTGFTDNIEKNKGHYGIRGIPCNAEKYLLADSLGQGSSYWKDKIYLSRDSGSLNVNNAIYLGAYLHGGDRNLANSSGWFNDIPIYPFYSCLPNINTPSSYNINTHNVIVAGKDFPTSKSIIIPDTLSAGTYYIYVYANPDDEVFEYPGVPQIRRSQFAINVQRPDAVVSSVVVPPSGIGGVPVSVTYTITNNGPGTVYNHLRKDRLYVSSSPVFDGSAQVVATYTYTENLPAGSGVPHTVNYTFPAATSGTRYFYVETNYDSSFKEVNQNNNISTAAAISMSPGNPADLVVSSFTLADTVTTTYQQFLNYTVQNNGPATTNAVWIDSLFISCSPTFDPATAYYVASMSQNATVAPGNSYTSTFSFALPYASYINNCFPASVFNNAYFFIKVNANGTLYEGSGTGNNILGTGQRIIKNPYPDLIVNSVSGSDSATVGRPYSVSWTVKNQGFLPGIGYNGASDYLFISPDSVFNANAIQLSSYWESYVLSSNQTYSDTKSPVIPALADGDYYLMVYTNRYVNVYESDYNNNINLIRDGAGAAKKIHVTRPDLPDLKDSLITYNNSVAIGQPLSIVNQISNNGIGVTYPSTWKDYYWLSSDFIPGNGNDLLLKQQTHNGNLNPGASYTDSVVTGTIPLNFTPGNYILIAHTNANGSVTESNSTNNLAFGYVNVYNPAPVDLMVENIQKPDTVILGDAINSALWTVYNNSPNSANGIASDGIYLSENNTLDSSAVLIGINNRTLNMGPLTRDTISYNPVVSGVTEGNYYLLVKADLQNNIPETNENNNATASVTPVFVKVNPLPLNVLTSDTMQTASRYFKLQIPDSLLGATIMVTLKSNDSLSVNNQMYIGGGYIPSAAHFDFAYGTPNYGNQQIIMSSVTDSIYYITIKCTTGNPPLQNITLKAEVLPFSIVSVDANAGGNIGNVTVRLIGSLFSNNMVAKLEKPGTVITASTVYYTSSTQVFATFNLQGAPLGVYDVKLLKPDSTVALLVNGFSVVPPNNGGLITGGGVNTGAGNGNQPGCDPGAASGLNSQLSIEIVLPDAAFGGWPFPIQINYNNPTNYDIPAQTRVLYSLNNIPVALTPAELDSAGPSLYLVLTEPNGPPGIIRAGGSGTITVYSRAPVTYPAHTLANFTIR